MGKQKVTKEGKKKRIKPKHQLAPGEEELRKKQRINYFKNKKLNEKAKEETG